MDKIEKQKNIYNLTYNIDRCACDVGTFSPCRKECGKDI